MDLPTDRRDEIGNLYRDINETAILLQQFIAEQTAYALTRQQIETGRSIQRSFLVEQLPCCDRADLAASFNPALDVAGDWYDAIPIDPVTYVVVADVCDKGIGAALFMSVFRTLLRYEILRRAAEFDSSDGCDLAVIVSMVNDYMAETHAASTMFATLFVGAYDHTSQALHYICAGHELPYVIRRDPALPLERLQVNHLAFEPGDLLLAYTDGLTDARSPDGEAWGVERLTALLEQLRPEAPDAQGLLDRILGQVRDHMGPADPFDDLTMIALRAR